MTSSETTPKTSRKSTPSISTVAFWPVCSPKICSTRFQTRTTKHTEFRWTMLLIRASSNCSNTKTTLLISTIPCSSIGWLFYQKSSTQSRSRKLWGRINSRETLKGVYAVTIWNTFDGKSLGTNKFIVLSSQSGYFVSSFAISACVVFLGLALFFITLFNLVVYSSIARGNGSSSPHEKTE